MSLNKLVSFLFKNFFHLSLVDLQVQSLKLYRWWKGKKVAIIGPTASGKDSLLARLQGQEIPARHLNSASAEHVQAFKVKFSLASGQALEFRCRGVINSGGETDYRDSSDGWGKACQDANVIFYMITYHDLLNPADGKQERIFEDMDWLQSMMSSVNPSALLHVLVNKCDELIPSHIHYPELETILSPEIVNEFEQQVIKRLRPYSGRYTGMTYISMKNRQLYTLGMNHALLAVYHAIDSKQDIVSPAA